MKPTKPQIIIASVSLILFGLLIFALLRGCHNNRIQAESYKTTITNQRAIIASLEAKGVESEKKFNDTISASRNQLKEAKESRDKVGDSLRQLRAESKKLIEKHKWAQYTDPTAVMMPKEFADDCESCFVKLEKYQELDAKFELRVDSVDKAHEKVEKDLSNRIGQLKDERTEAIIAAKNSIDSCADIIKKNEPKGKLFLKLGTLSIGQVLPNAVGVGLMYQDKRNRQYGAKVYGSPYGKIYEAEIGLPLSLRRRR